MANIQEQLLGCAVQICNTDNQWTDYTSGIVCSLILTFTANINILCPHSNWEISKAYVRNIFLCFNIPMLTQAIFNPTHLFCLYNPSFSLGFHFYNLCIIKGRVLEPLVLFSQFQFCNFCKQQRSF